ncbi:hypothetical protein PN498_20145 [Oscillatoria sp. CS-180]|uniref:hypothetical protein n=1 Tax=Oscillatoria sp. CS-180 TaxID=3021720 RepID=UPI00232F54B8|nr:hypothetical protein [Oscillatoria sp. CS-180]MDB9528314.1 hypothetical protein [Oscillatoria sp. CS-180]
MTMLETAIAKLQQLPNFQLQKVSNFIDLLMYRQQHSTIGDENEGERAKAWANWFESVDHLEVTSINSVGNYQQHLLSKYRQQGLEL